MADLGSMIETLKQNPPMMIGLIVIAIVVVIIFFYFRKKKNNEVESQLKLEMNYAWGREEIRNHTIKDLDRLSRFFTKYTKRLVVGGVVNKKIVGKGIGTMNIRAKRVVGSNIIKGKTIYQFGEDVADLTLLKYKIPRWESLTFFPFSWITVKRYLMFETKDVQSENLFDLRLKCDEFQELYGVFFPMSEAMTKIAKIEEYPFRGFYEEINGRLNNEPAKIAQLDMSHTQRLAVADKQAEAMVRLTEANKQPLRSM